MHLFRYKRRKQTNLLTVKSNTIIDVGTNIGETILNFAKLADQNGEIHRFEPDALNYERCVGNLKLNTFTNITLNKLGLGAKAGQYFTKVNTPSNSRGNRISSEYIENNALVVKPLHWINM